MTLTIKNLIVIIFISIMITSCSGSEGGSKTNTIDVVETVNEEEQLQIPTVVSNTLSPSISVIDVISNMGIGINLGNTLDAPTEGEWALAAQEYYIQAYSDAGFKHVRIPVTWNNHVAEEAPYTIEAEFLDRTEQIVEWALARDLYVILNVHHDDWLKEDFSNISKRNRFDSIWMQLSERFKNKSSHLIFEIFNEPHAVTIDQLNELNQRTLAIIRNQTPNRLVVFAGTGFSSLDDLLSIGIPDVNDKYLIGNFHSYDPWEFAGICIQDWGSDEDKLALKEIYQKASDWSSKHNIPIMVNEFGVAKYDFEKPENSCAQAQREDYIKAHVDYAKEFGIAATFWDDGGSFSTYDRADNSWGPEKDILVGQ